MVTRRYDEDGDDDDGGGGGNFPNERPIQI
jgi:hypothetical protein